MSAEIEGYRYRGVTRFLDRSRDRFFGRTPIVSERFEYKCPYCNHINVRYERTERIVCSKCGRGFG